MSVTITKVQNVIFWGGEGARRAEKQVCELATLGIKVLTLLLKKKQQINVVLPFLDVLVEKSSFKFIIFIYRKLRFAYQCICLNSFST